MWRGAVQFSIGLLLAIVFAGAAATAVASTFVLLKDGLTSIGDPELFEAKVRHYTDRLVVAPDGMWHLVQVRHPVVQIIGTVVLSWLVLLGSAVALRRVLRPRESR